MGLPKWGLTNEGSSSVFQFGFSTRVGLTYPDFPHFGKPKTVVRHARELKGWSLI